MLIVQKFGGSSLSDPERLRHVARLCLKAREKAELVVVVSAMGGTTDSLTGRAREMNEKPSPRELDALVTTGEQQAAALLVMTMEQLGLPAVSLTGWQAGILTDKHFGDGPRPRRLGHHGGGPGRGAGGRRLRYLYGRKGHLHRRSPGDPGGAASPGDRRAGYAGLVESGLEGFTRQIRGAGACRQRAAAPAVLL